jgi:hypothetical protein
LLLGVLLATHSLLAACEPREVAFEPVSRGVVRIRPPAGETVGPGDELDFFDGAEPIARGSFFGAGDGWATFAITKDVTCFEVSAKAFIIGRLVLGASASRWPEQATLQAHVDSVGPGGRSAWIAAGSDDGVAPSGSWWLCIGGQPTARCDVIHLAPRVCFCSVVALARTPTLLPGVRVSLGPTPAAYHTGRVRSAVAYAEARGDAALIWIAAPSGIPCPPDPHVDFYRAGQYIGHGLVERRDDRFWYIRFTAAGASPAGTDASSPRVGDEAVVRSEADIEQRRFVVHVFDLTTAGALLNAGEADALAVGDTLTVQRGSATVGQAVVREVHRTYAIAAPVDSLNQFALRVGDELRLRPAPPPPRILGSIERVVDELLFSARLTGSAAPLGTPLAVQHEGRTVGVAMLVTVDEAGKAGGFVFARSLTEPLSPGMELRYAEDASGAPSSSQPVLP